MKSTHFNPFFPAVQSFGHMVEDLINKGLNEVSQNPIFQNSIPAVNVIENDNNFVLEVAAPGLEKKDFVIKIEKNQLQISADKKIESEEVKPKFSRKEFSYHSFKRYYNLSDNIDTKNISATYENGILNISLPKLNVQPESSKNIDIL